ncbi:divergent PAP2 family protein [Candidatus Parcubacteria bacterium]|nr:divergent PAP2 family protein [Candidatus Parcubacteria bacterium]
MSYHILLAPIIAGFITQIVKLFLKSNRQKFSLKNLMAYSGMPSGHSALIISLATIIGLEEGIKSPLFSISIVLAIIVIRDALGIRRYLGQHGHILNILVKDLKDDDVLDAKYPHLLERIGHTPSQVLIGSIIGLLVSIIIYFLAN